MAYYDLLTRSQTAKKVLPSYGYTQSAEVIELSGKERSKSYSKNSVVFVKGGTLESNQKIVRSPADVLLEPFESGVMSVDSAVVQIAKDNDVTFGISLDQFLKAQKFSRVRLAVNYRRLVQLCQKGRGRILLVSGARNELGLRNPLQLASLGVFLGMTKQQAKWSISKVPEYLLEVKN